MGGWRGRWITAKLIAAARCLPLNRTPINSLPPPRALFRVRTFTARLRRSSPFPLLPGPTPPSVNMPSEHWTVDPEGKVCPQQLLTASTLLLLLLLQLLLLPAGSPTLCGTRHHTCPCN